MICNYDAIYMNALNSYFTKFVPFHLPLYPLQKSHNTFHLTIPIECWVCLSKLCATSAFWNLILQRIQLKSQILLMMKDKFTRLRLYLRPNFIPDIISSLFTYAYSRCFRINLYPLFATASENARLLIFWKLPTIFFHGETNYSYKSNL